MRRSGPPMAVAQAHREKLLFGRSIAEGEIPAINGWSFPNTPASLGSPRLSCHVDLTGLRGHCPSPCKPAEARQSISRTAPAGTRYFNSAHKVRSRVVPGPAIDSFFASFPHGIFIPATPRSPCIRRYPGLPRSVPAPLDQSRAERCHAALVRRRRH